ncbi:hypothetical protein [Pseudescherichia sp.]|uniref:hypothetical protein n=1 Tax=Pseudescherichia sp. TaxID=2055881 RepID=UPI00289B28D1|nr:hypothetical protein [Pseudescherichia sp.]
MKKIILAMLMLASVGAHAETLPLLCTGVKGEPSQDKLITLEIADGKATANIANNDGKDYGFTMVKGWANFVVSDDKHYDMMDFTERTFEKERQGVQEWFEGILYMPTSEYAKENPQSMLDGWAFSLLHHVNGKNNLQTVYRCSLQVK